MKESIPVDVIRVFADENGRFGNELGIIESTDATRGKEQRLAAQLGFSETVFIDEVRDAAASVDNAASADAAPGARVAVIRIFTPAVEMPFAGHPSVGAAWWLAQRGQPVAALIEPAGAVVVTYDGELTWITAHASWAPVFEWMPLPTPARVHALDPAEFLVGQHYAWAWIDESAGGIRSRMFAPALGVAEDEATGAAAVRITVELGRDLDISQGTGSRIHTRRGRGESVRVGGRTVADRRLLL